MTNILGVEIAVEDNLTSTGKWNNIAYVLAP